MLKSTLLFITVFFSQISFSAECTDANGQDIFNQPEVFTALIENSESCYQAAELAKACAWGSSMDSMTAGTAYNVCAVEFEAQNPSVRLQKLLGIMEGFCSDKYEQMDGSMYLSMNAFCYLSSIEWALGIATEY